MLLLGRNIKKEYGIQEVLNIPKLEVREGDRIGLVGRNGTGKSTLLDVLYGNVPCDEGVIERNCEIAMIRQMGLMDRDAEGRFISQMRIKDSAIMSGGEKTRLAIAAAFSKHAPLLFADEPTTNLDVEGIETLEKMLKGYRGAVLLVSHDRQLLDRVCNGIWELEDGKLRVFPGNYTDWFQQRKREREFAEFEYEKYRNEKRRLEKSIQAVKQDVSKMKKPPKRMSSSEWILYKGTASIQQGHVQGRVSALTSRLEHLEVKERPKELPEVSMKLGTYHPMKAKAAAKFNGLSVSFQDHMVLDKAYMQVLTGKKTFLVGANGAGKSTMIRSLIHQDENTFVTSEAKIGYFSQEQENLMEDKTVLENVMSTSAVPEHVCRAVLANLYLNQNDVHKKVSVLSGGERVKTAIAKVLVSESNFLIFDEPTNHMDVYTMEGLEKLLKNYAGTLLVVSHDRKLVENLADVVYEVKDQTVTLR